MEYFGDEDFNEFGEVIKCPHCNELISEEDVIKNYGSCPYCFEKVELKEFDS